MLRDTPMRSAMSAWAISFCTRNAFKRCANIFPISSAVEKLKSKNKDVVTRFLLSEVDNFNKAWPLIKLCVGESFEKEHWKRLITLLDMPKEVTLDNMKFKHLLDAVPIMIKKSKDIKELSDKA